METIELANSNTVLERIPLNNFKKIKVELNENESCKFRLSNFTKSFTSTREMKKSGVIDIDAMHLDYSPLYIEFMILKEPCIVKYELL